MSHKSPAKTPLEAALRRRHYIHFDMPMPRNACEALVTNQGAVARHAFYPFLRLDVVRPKIKRVPGGSLKKSVKIREIRYAAHADAAIYAFYGAELSIKYETILHQLGLEKQVIAFRQLGKSNIELALEAFDWIATQKQCVALGFDVKDFFGSLDHRFLRDQWARVLGTPKLPDDHFAVFRSLTKHATVDLVAARQELGLKRSTLRTMSRLCTAKEFRDVIRAKGLVYVNELSRGIPQGSPISALLSNIYMLPFDEAVRQVADTVGGFYRRYCDDILVVVPAYRVLKVKKAIADAVASLSLELQHAKTLECRFSPRASKPLQYLGLVFDGSRITLRHTGIARHYAKMRRGVGLYADALDGATPMIKQRRKELLNRYTEYTGENNRTYFRYIKRAVEKSGSAALRRQLRFHQRRFRAMTL